MLTTRIHGQIRNPSSYCISHAIQAPDKVKNQNVPDNCASSGVCELNVVWPPNRKDPNAEILGRMQRPGPLATSLLSVSLRASWKIATTHCIWPLLFGDFASNSPTTLLLSLSSPSLHLALSVESA